MSTANVVSDVVYDHKTFADIEPGDLVILHYELETLVNKPIIGLYNLCTVWKVWRGADSTSIRYTVMTGKHKGAQASVYVKSVSPILLGTITSRMR